MIAQGDVTEHPIISADDGGTGKIVQKTYFAAQWVGAFTSEQYHTNETVGENSIKTMTVSVPGIFRLAILSLTTTADTLAQRASP